MSLTSVTICITFIQSLVEHDVLNLTHQWGLEKQFTFLSGVNGVKVALIHACLFLFWILSGLFHILPWFHSSWNDNTRILKLWRHYWMIMTYPFINDLFFCWAAARRNWTTSVCPRWPSSPWPWPSSGRWTGRPLPSSSGPSRGPRRTGSALSPSSEARGNLNRMACFSQYFKQCSLVQRSHF